MLAEIFMLRLEAAVRAAKKRRPASASSRSHCPRRRRRNGVGADSTLAEST
jgi:hypothetical protein